MATIRNPRRCLPLIGGGCLSEVSKLTMNPGAHLVPMETANGRLMSRPLVNKHGEDRSTR